MKLFKKIPLLIASVVCGFLALAGIAYGQSVIRVQQGGTGYGTTTAGSILLTTTSPVSLTRLSPTGSDGLFLRSSSTSPTLWDFTTPSGALSGGTPGFSALWSSASALTIGTLRDNGTVSGVNATSSTTTFNIQGSGSLDPFNIASSSGVSRLFVSVNGNVGIGTTTPAYGLVASSSGTTQLAITGAQNPTFHLISNSTNAAARNWNITENNCAFGDLIFNASSSNAPAGVSCSSSANILTLFATGRLGVGTTTPAANLAVQGQSGNTIPVFIVASSTSAQLLTVASNGSTTLSSLGTGNVCTSGGSFYNCAVAGAGTVTSVAMTVPTGLAISGSPITTAGTLALSLDTGYVIPLQSTLDTYSTYSYGSSTYVSFGYATSTFQTKLTFPLSIANGGTATTTFQSGSVLFYNGTTISENLNQLFWDNTNFRLGVGSGTPIATLSVKGKAGSSDPLIIASSTDVMLLRIQPNGSTTLSSLGSGAVRSVSGSLFNGVIDISTDTNLTAGRSLTLTGDDVAADAELFTHKKTISILAISGTISATTTAAQFELPQASTITEVSCSTDAGTATIQLDERARATPNTAGTDVMTSTLACDTDAQTTTTFSNAGIAADVPVNLDIDSVASSPTRVRIHIKFQYDD